MSVTELNVRLLLAVAVIALCVQLAGWLAQRLRQPRVVGEIAAGILLGPSLLGLVAPAVMDYLFPGPVVDGIKILSQFGLVLFMFLVGMHLDLGSLRSSGRTIGIVAQASVIAPFALGVGLAALAHSRFGGDTDPVVFCAFVGCAMAITALPVLARMLPDLGLEGHRVGVIALACAAVNDIVAWCLVAAVAALHGADGPGGPLLTLGLASVYVAVMLGVVRPLLARLPELPIWALLVVTITSAWVAEQVGIHAIIGAFAAGLVMPRRPGWQERVGARFDVLVRHLLLPLFFVAAGMATRVDELTVPAVVLLACVLVVAVAGKLGSAALAARLAGERWSDALGIGVLLNARGVTELVILSLGLQLGIISTTVYTVMVLMALLTTTATAPLIGLLRRWRRVGDPEPDDGRATVAAPAAGGTRPGT